MAFEKREIAARAADEENAEKFVICPGERKGVENFGAGGVGCPLERRGESARLLEFAADERRETIRLRNRAVNTSQILRGKIRVEIAVKERASAFGERERREK